MSATATSRLPSFGAHTMALQARTLMQESLETAIKQNGAISQEATNLYDQAIQNVTKKVQVFVGLTDRAEVAIQEELDSFLQKLNDLVKSVKEINSSFSSSSGPSCSSSSSSSTSSHRYSTVSNSSSLGSIALCTECEDIMREQLNRAIAMGDADTTETALRLYSEAFEVISRIAKGNEFTRLDDTAKDNMMGIAKLYVQDLDTLTKKVKKESKHTSSSSPLLSDDSSTYASTSTFSSSLSTSFSYFPDSSSLSSSSFSSSPSSSSTSTHSFGDMTDAFRVNPAPATPEKEKPVTYPILKEAQHFNSYIVSFFKDDAWFEQGAKVLSKHKKAITFEDAWNTLPKIGNGEMSVEEYLKTDGVTSDTSDVMSMERRFYFHLFCILIRQQPTLYKNESLSLILDARLLSSATKEQTEEAGMRTSIDYGLLSFSQTIQNFNPSNSDPHEVNLKKHNQFLKAVDAHEAFFKCFSIWSHVDLIIEPAKRRIESTERFTDFEGVRANFQKVLLLIVKEVKLGKLIEI